MPGSRAADLGLSRGTVVQVSTQLIAEGWLVGTPGSGTRVAHVQGGPTMVGAARTQQPAGNAKPQLRMVDPRPGRPDLSTFPDTIKSRKANLWPKRMTCQGARRAP